MEHIAAIFGPAFVGGLLCKRLKTAVLTGLGIALAYAALVVLAGDFGNVDVANVLGRLMGVSLTMIVLAAAGHFVRRGVAALKADYVKGPAPVQHRTERAGVLTAPGLQESHPEKGHKNPNQDVTTYEADSKRLATFAVAALVVPFGVPLVLYLFGVLLPDLRGSIGDFMVVSVWLLVLLPWIPPFFVLYFALGFITRRANLTLAASFVAAVATCFILPTYLKLRFGKDLDPGLSALYPFTLVAVFFASLGGIIRNTVKL